MQDLINQTLRLKHKFKQKGNDYDKRSRLIDLVEEVGELAQAIHIVEGFKNTNHPDKQKTVDDVADAICDCLYELILIADMYQLELTREYRKTLDHLEKRLEDGEFSA